MTKDNIRKDDNEDTTGKKEPNASSNDQEQQHKDDDGDDVVQELLQNIQRDAMSQDAMDTASSKQQFTTDDSAFLLQQQEQAEKLEAARQDKPQSNMNKNSDDFRLSASAVPIPTELQRHESTPGAVGVRGILHNSNVHRISVTAPQQEQATPQNSSSNAPLLTATLVVEEEEEEESPRVVVQNAAPSMVMAKAEPMPETEESSPDNKVADNNLLFPLPASESKRRRFVLVLISLLCCFMLVGIVAGVGVTRWHGDTKENNVVEPRPNNDRGDRDDEDDSDDGGPSGDKDDGPTAGGPPSADKSLRTYYLIQWGSLTGGCTAPQNARLDVSCKNGGALTVAYTPANVTCSSTIDVSRQACHFVVDNDEMQQGENVTRRLRRGGIPGNSDVLELQSNDVQYSFFEPSRRELQSNSDPNWQGIPVDIAPLHVSQGHVVAYCIGTQNDESMRLLASVSFDEELDQTRGLPEDQRMGFCTHKWQVKPNEFDAVNNVTTEDRRYGGGGSGFLSVTMLCPIPPTTVVEAYTLQCADVGTQFIGQQDGASVGFCVHLEQCADTSYDCVVAKDTMLDDDPCRFDNCTLPFLPIHSVEPLNTNIRSCNLPNTAAERDWTLPVMLDMISPYILTDEDFVESLESIRELLFAMWLAV